MTTLKGFAILWDYMSMFCVTESMAKNGSCLRSALSDEVKCAKKPFWFPSALNPVPDNLLFRYVLWKAKTDKRLWNCCLFLANWAIATIHTGHRVVCYGVGCESTCRGGQCYRRLTPWLIPNGPDSQNRCPEGRIIKDSPHVVPDHDDGGGPLNLLIVSLYNPPPSLPVSEFTFIGPLFSTTPAVVCSY